MDIRKFLKKDNSGDSKGGKATKPKSKDKSPSSSKPSASSSSAHNSRRRSKAAPIVLDDDDDDDDDKNDDDFKMDVDADDDDDDFRPTKTKTKTKTSTMTPSSRKPAKQRSSSKSKDDASSKPSASESKKRDRTAADVGNGGVGAGFGGSGGGGDGDDDGDDGATAAPASKKPKWVPRTDDPPNRGNKPLPVGAADCLAGQVFVITGVLDSLLRDECQDLVRSYGARVVSAPSRKVTYGIVGTEPGQSKISKLKANNTPMIDEDELFSMINKTGPEGGSSGVGEKKENDDEDVKMEDEEIVGRIASRKEEPTVRDKKKKSTSKVKKEEPMVVDDEEDEDDVKPLHPKKKVFSSSQKSRSKSLAASSSAAAKTPANHKKNSAPALWVDKYRPKSASDLVGNPKLIRDLRGWLDGWRDKFLRGDGHTMKVKDRKDWDHAAALLVGSPGIGKTSAAHIVCREAGFEPHEFNASDVRNKAGVAELAETAMVANTLSKYLKIGTHGTGGMANPAQCYPNGQVLIMDEVDGMSGGDRGGSQELIKLIKKTKVPIICIANDDSSSNMRSLANSCFKLRFRKPTATTVAKRLAEIARREGFHAMQDQVLAKLAEGCNGDIRQMINLLQSWRVSSPALTYNSVKERLDVEGKTVVQKSIFELSLSFFKPGGGESANSLPARTDNYFADSDLVPLFVQENYIHSIGASSSLDALADAAESIAEGDLCNAAVRSEQRWELMPACAIMSAIRPGVIVAGGLNTQPMFPSFLGNLSKGNKWKRIIQGLEMKVRAAPSTTSGSTRSFRLDYIPALTTCLASPLILGGVSGVDQVIERLDAYYLERDPDWEEILEAGVYGKGRSPLENIQTKVKSTLTQEYNARSHARSTVTGARVGVKGLDGGVVTSSKKAEKEAEGILDDVEEEKEEEEEEEGKDDIMNEFGVKKGRGGKGRARGKSSRVSSSGTSRSKSSGGGRRGRGGGRGGRGRR